MVHLNSTNTIITRADTIVRETGTRDPERIARELGISIKEVGFDRQKGVYKVIKRNRFIFITPEERIARLHFSSCGSLSENCLRSS